MMQLVAAEPKGWEVLEFEDYHRGNYGSGNYSHTRKFIGKVLVESEETEVSYDQYSEDDWTEERARILLFVDNNGQTYLASCTIVRGKGGRGSQDYREEKWDIRAMPDFPLVP